MSEYTRHPWPGSTGAPQAIPSILPSPVSEAPLSPPPHASFQFADYPPSPPIDDEFHSGASHARSSSNAVNQTEYATPEYSGTNPYHMDAAGLEPVVDRDCDKEVVFRQEYVPAASYGKPSIYDESQLQLQEERTRSTDWTGPTQTRKPRPWRTIGILTALTIVILALGLGLGLGLGLHIDRPSSSASVEPTANIYSTSGAFNGSGLALASQSFAGTGYGTIVLYFQHWSGQIRWMQLQSNGNWGGGDQSTIVATDAKNATPIAAVSYAMNGISTWHIFYINSTNHIRQRTNSNTTNIWRDGPINALGLQAMDDPNVGLQACWYGNFYGSANYSHSPVPGTGSNTTSPDSVVGIHLLWGTSPTAIQEYQWTYGTETWIEQGTLEADGHAGIACYTWGPGSVSYLMTVNLDSAVQIRWKDLNPNVTATPTHPVATWTNTTFTIPSVHPNTSLGYTNFFYLQNAAHNIVGYNISWDAENTSIVTADTLTVGGDVALPGSHLTVTALPNPSGGDELIVFNQVAGEDVTEFVRDIEGGQWTSSSLPVPDD